MLKVIIPRILDLSITKYFDSLKETFQKETLSLRAERFWDFRRNSIGSDSKETEKKTYITQKPQGIGISAEPAQALRKMNGSTELSTKVNITDFQVRRN